MTKSQHKRKSRLPSWYLDACKRWDELISLDRPELEYLAFLSQHAGLLLSATPLQAIVISEPELGSSYRPDFIVVEDDFSRGLIYHLFEIEVPQVELCNTKGDPAPRLIAGLNQIKKWKRWIATHYNEALLDVLPSAWAQRGFSPLICKYTLIIGRRPNDNAYSVYKPPEIPRDWLSQNEDVEIRSFDYLSSIAARGPRWDDLWGLSQYDRRYEDELTSRNWKAITSKQWKQLVKSHLYSGSHLLEAYIHLLPSLRHKDD